MIAKFVVLSALVAVAYGRAQFLAAAPLGTFAHPLLTAPAVAVAHTPVVHAPVVHAPVAVAHAPAIISSPAVAIAHTATAHNVAVAQTGPAVTTHVVNAPAIGVVPAPVSFTTGHKITTVHEPVEQHGFQIAF